ncbi:MAG: N-acetyl-gamma-glutamyl-phosphate reductase [Ignavibacteria bacterium]|nr:N-acetyl-gamma-glutamyl-phosphate reductase [Ignavibacteria bacterium]
MIETAIIGASGYSGAELMRILVSRGDVHIRSVAAASSAGKRVDEVYPEFSGRLDLTFTRFDDDDLDKVDVAFVALPSGESMRVVPDIMRSVGKVIDLSGDFRLSGADEYERFYKHEHIATDLLGKAVYGLPELNRKAIAKASLLANPGCYPTSAILALLPALKEGLIEPAGIAISSMSGTSGAGRAASLEMSFTEVHDNIRAYKVGTHQHIPEIQEVLSGAVGKEVTVSFVPHLVPMNRGIYTTIHARLTSDITAADLLHSYQEYYAEAPFVRIRQQVPQVKDVVRTNYCDIGVAVDHRTHQAVIFSTIDNLVKGAAGQAVQNLNLMCGLPEQLGLN